MCKNQIKLIPIIFLFIFLATSCGVPNSISCTNCETENDISHLYCSNCGEYLEISEKQEKNLESERIDNRSEIIYTWMNEGKYQEAYNLIDSLPIVDDADINDANRELGYECLYLLAEATEDNYEAYKIYTQIDHYKDSIEKGKARYYECGLEALNKDNILDALLVFYNLGDYKDSKAKLEQLVKGNESSLYEKGKASYMEGDFTSAKAYLGGLVNYNDANQFIEYINIIEKIQGIVFYGKYDSMEARYIFIDGNTLYTYNLKEGTKDNREIVITDTKKYGYYLVTPGDYGKEYEDLWKPIYVRISDDGEIILHEYVKKYHDKYTTTDFVSYEKTRMDKEYLDEAINNYTPPKEKVAPRIGMTADEVKASTWGYPSKINKTTYSWGVSEQWVYSNNRYIYLEDGVVTAIQE